MFTGVELGGRRRKSEAIYLHSIPLIISFSPSLSLFFLLQNPINSDVEDESEDEEEEEIVAKPPPPAKKAAPAAAAGGKRSKYTKSAKDSESSESESSDEFDSDSSSESSSDDEAGGRVGRSKWVRRTKTKPTPAPVTKKEVEKKKPAPTTREVPTSTEQAPSTLTAVTDVQDGFTEVGKGGKAMTYKPELILKYLREVHEARGKKNTDKASQVKILQELRAIAVAPYHRIVTLLSLISAQFDLYAPSFSSGYMSIDVWKQTQEEVLELLRVLEKYADTMVVRPDADEEPLTPEEESGKVEVIRPQIRGSVASFIYRLDDEFTRSLQQIDPHSVEYIDRLRDERSLYATLVKAQAYFHRCGLKDSEASTVLRRLEHIYFKPDAVIIALGKELEEESETQPDALIHNLATQLYQSDAPVIRARAILCHIYHHALQDRYHVARDMLLMSHLQDSIHQAEPLIQIHYNRALVQLGLCAFRAGMIREAHGALHELVQTGRVRELLAQGPPQPRYNAPPISPEQERAERALLLPFHMHIHLELLEAVYLVSSMLLEVPNMASVRAAQASGTWTLEMRKRVISKTFRRMLDYHERQAFTGKFLLFFLSVNVFFALCVDGAC